MSVPECEEPWPRPLSRPLEAAVNYAFQDTAALASWREQGKGDRFYARLASPNMSAVEAALAALEKTSDAAIYSSGMAAVAGVVLSLARSGDRIVVDRRVYGGTASFLKTFAPRFGWTIHWASSELELLDALETPARLLIFESPTNPLLRVLDISALARAARAAGAISVFDNTLATPLAQNPAELGIDLVVHSATKALNGHHDVLAGAVCGSRDLIEELKTRRSLLGSVLDAHPAWLLERGLSTLSLRVQRSHESAARLARKLFAQHPRGLESVSHPSLESHPDHALSQRQMRSYGSVLCLELQAGLAAARSVVDRLRHFAIAASLGGNESLVSLPSLTTHAGWSEREMLEVGLSPGMIRLSIGLEDPRVLEADLRQAFSEAFELEGSD
jgi:cystathionine gamma-synthase